MRNLELLLLVSFLLLNVSFSTNVEFKEESQIKVNCFEIPHMCWNDYINFAAQNMPCKSILLTGCIFSASSFKCLYDWLLMNMDTLQCISFTDCNLNESFFDGKTFRAFKNLKKLKLVNLPLQEQTVLDIIANLPASIECIHVENVNESVETISVIASFPKGLSNLLQIIWRDMQYNNKNFIVLLRYVNLAKLTLLDISGNRPSDALYTLFLFKNPLKNIQILRLNNCKIGNTAAKNLISLFTEMPDLIELDLCNNFLTTLYLKENRYPFCKNEKLTKLNLDQNSLKAIEILALMSSIEAFPLTSLVLQICDSIDYMQLIERISRNWTLETFRIRVQSLSVSLSKTVAYCDKLLTVECSHFYTYLKTFEISSSQLSANCQLLIIKQIAAMLDLKFLSLSFSITKYTISSFINAIRNLSKLEGLQISLDDLPCELVMQLGATINELKNMSSLTVSCQGKACQLFEFIHQPNLKELVINADSISREVFSSIDRILNSSKVHNFEIQGNFSYESVLIGLESSRSYPSIQTFTFGNMNENVDGVLIVNSLLQTMPNLIHFKLICSTYTSEMFEGRLCFLHVPILIYITFIEKTGSLLHSECNSLNLHHTPYVQSVKRIVKDAVSVSTKYMNLTVSVAALLQNALYVFLYSKSNESNNSIPLPKISNLLMIISEYSPTTIRKCQNRQTAVIFDIFPIVNNEFQYDLMMLFESTHYRHLRMIANFITRNKSNELQFSLMYALLEVCADLGIDFGKFANSLSLNDWSMVNILDELRRCQYFANDAKLLQSNNNSIEIDSIHNSPILNQNFNNNTNSNVTDDASLNKQYFHPFKKIDNYLNFPRYAKGFDGIVTMFSNRYSNLNAHKMAAIIKIFFSTNEVESFSERLAVIDNVTKLFGDKESPLRVMNDLVESDLCEIVEFLFGTKNFIRYLKDTILITLNQELALKYINESILDNVKHENNSMENEIYHTNQFNTNEFQISDRSDKIVANSQLFSQADSSSTNALQRNQITTDNKQSDAKQPIAFNWSFLVQKTSKQIQDRSILLHISSELESVLKTKCTLQQLFHIHKMILTTNGTFLDHVKCVVCQEWMRRNALYFPQNIDSSLHIHGLHRNCWIEWSKRQPNCPICRADLCN